MCSASLLNQTTTRKGTIMAARTRRKAAAPVETDDAFEELEEVDEVEDDEVEEAPAPKTRARKATKSTAPADKPATGTNELGSVWLAEHITEVTGVEYDSRGIRMLLRKIAKDPEGPLARTIGEDRTRYTFKGPNDAVVKAVVRMVKSGEATAVKREGLDKVKSTAPAKRTRAKATEDEAPEPTPRTRTRKATPAKAAAPAKATPTRRRTRAAAE